MDIIFMFLLVTSHVHRVRAQHAPAADTPNVGTVLFTAGDLHDKQWTASNVSLLRARMYLQDILPSVRLIDSINDEYLNYLIKYLQDSYGTIKREVTDPFLRDILKTAVSDTVGGYLKIWVLPITKYSYYGGAISLESAFKMFGAYDDIKKSLNTDGDRWRKANGDLLNYVSISVAALDDNSMALDENCNQLTYYEKSNAGLTFPLPFIDWNITPSTMFVPLKNLPLIPLNSLNSSKYLLKYYDLTKHCFRSENLENWQEFDNRFQTWLYSDIVPHLDDDDLYVAFGGVLSLLNKTRIKQASIKFINCCDDAHKVLKHPSVHGMCSHCSSKKLMIVGVILLVEIVWCVPALIYIVCSRKRKNNNKFEKMHNDNNTKRYGGPRKLWNSITSRFNRKAYYQIHCTDTIEDNNSGSDNEKYYKRDPIEPLLPIIGGIKLSSYRLKLSSNEKNTNDDNQNIRELIDIPLENKFSKYDITIKSNTSKIESSKHSRFKVERECKCQDKLNEYKFGTNVKYMESKKCLTHPKNSESLIQNVESFQIDTVNPELVRFIETTTSTVEENDTPAPVSANGEEPSVETTREHGAKEKNLRIKFNHKRPRTVTKKYPEVKLINKRITPGNIILDKKNYKKEAKTKLVHVVQRPTVETYNETLRRNIKPSRIPRKITEVNKVSCIGKQITCTNRTESLNDSTEKLRDKDKEQSKEKLNITF